MATVTHAPAGQLEAATQKFVDDLTAQGGPPLYTLSPQGARQVLETLQSQPIEKQPAVVDDVVIPGGPSGHISLRIVRPEGAIGTLPAIVYFHGGGWILGSKNTHDRLIREIANGAHAALVFVNYTPSPEAHYPIPIEEAYAATEYVAKLGDETGIDGSRLAIVGDSVGGNMAAVVAMLAKQRGGPQIEYQVLLYPVTDAGLDTDSYQQYADGPWLTKRAMEWFWDAYAPDRARRTEITASPLRASVQELAGLPPALVIVDENDVLRDEGEAYAHKLMAAGVEVTAMRLLGTIHDFMMLNPLARTPAVRGAVSAVSEVLRKVLSSRPKPSLERGHI